MNRNYCFYLFLFASLVCSVAFAETSSNPAKPKVAPSIREEISDITSKVDIKPLARDIDISRRIGNILKTTQWFEAPTVTVEDGVVFLGGKTKSLEHKNWAGQLAKNTQSVVAVVNQIEIVSSGNWYLQEILQGLEDQYQHTLRGLPFFGFALIILFITWLFSRSTSAYADKILQKREIHPLLSQVIAKAIAIVCLLFGLYLILQVLGLTSVALTLLGGTGIIGIILGIAFRDITENLLASVLLSIQNPFRRNDLITLAEVTGYVKKLTIRATVLLTPDGQEVQIPNATVYKSIICNYSINPNRRETFVVSINYDSALSEAQETALQVLLKHPAVLDDPEPTVLVEALKSAAIDIRIYFWVDSNKYNLSKVKSSLIRLVKGAFNKKGIDFSGSELTLNFSEQSPLSLYSLTEKPNYKSISKESMKVATDAEGNLDREDDSLYTNSRPEQANEETENLLNPSPPVER